ncbi:general transcription factor IIIA, b [Cololabis saira]|uniref:general transcription factor IIIA, b n=1 Tax=Cololabis saira TaxID=129043 RepID=UPI002AD56585|nr:general transcription factor IIIA, b [Cololabis saira]
MGESVNVQKTYVCSFFECNARFSRSWKLEAHLCKHTGLKPFSCAKCDKSFCTRYQLTRHELNHSGEKPHKCLVDGCSEAFVTNASLKNHMIRLHDHQKRLYQCDHEGCGKNFGKKKQLKSHKSEHDQLLYHCTVSGCKREFPSCGKLKHHERVHEGYPCNKEDCPFKGKTWTELVKHTKEHKVKLPCGECKKLFNNSWFLSRHVLYLHSGKKKLFSCPREGCDKKFTRHLKLESHVVGEHKGKKSFSCPHANCGKSFAMKESLRRHEVAHSPAKAKLKKQRPKARPSRVAEEAAANKEETNKLAGKLLTATLDDKP